MGPLLTVGFSWGAFLGGIYSPVSLLGVLVYCDTQNRPLGSLYVHMHCTREEGGSPLIVSTKIAPKTSLAASLCGAGVSLHASNCHCRYICTYGIYDCCHSMIKPSKGGLPLWPPTPVPGRASLLHPRGARYGKPTKGTTDSCDVSQTGARE